MPNLHNISAVSQFTVKGNDDLSNDIASIAELQIKSIIRTNLEGFGMRASMTAKSISEYDGLATGVYRMPKRNVPGTDYNFETGIIAQKSGAYVFTVKMDQHLTWNFPFESFDIDRYSKADPATRAAMVNEWVSTVVEAFIQSLEALFLRGVIDYTVANYDVRPQNVMIIDIDSIVDKNSALNIYSMLKDTAIRLHKLYTPTAMGMEQTQLRLAISLELYQKFVRYIPEIFVTSEALKILATGKLYKDSAFGLPMFEHIFLNTKFDKGPETGLNKDLDFDFTGTHAIFMIDDAVAMPMGMRQVEWIKNPNTLNMEFKAKNMGSVPEIYRSDYVLVSRPAAPTPTEINAAKAMVYDPLVNDYSRSFQLADFDKLGPDVTVNFNKPLKTSKAKKEVQVEQEPKTELNIDNEVQVEQEPKNDSKELEIK